MTTAPVTDLDGDDLTWVDHAIAGSDRPARLAMLHADPDRGTRTVLVRFPDGWRRDAVGHQPAGEEMVILSGALSISGRTAAVGDYLVVEPVATRSATSVADGTSALVFFSGPGGGWANGPAEAPGGVHVVRLVEGEVRPARPGLVGSTSVDTALSGRTFDDDVEVVWTQTRRYCHVPAGLPVPAGEGSAVLRRLGRPA